MWEAPQWMKRKLYLLSQREGDLSQDLYDSAKVAVMLVDALNGILDFLAVQSGKSELGGRPAVWLSTENEDVRALSALVLSERHLRMHLAIEIVVADEIKSSFATAQRTGCKIALAYALHRLGDDDLIERARIKGYVSSLEDRVRKISLDPKIASELRKRGMSADEEYIRKSFEDFFFLAVCQAVVVDIISGGRAEIGYMLDR